MFATHVTGLARLTGLLLLACLAFFAMPREAQASCNSSTGWCGNASEAWDRSDQLRSDYYSECSANPPQNGNPCNHQILCGLPKSDTRPLKLVLSQYTGQFAAMVVCPQWPSGPLNLGYSYYSADNKITGGCPDGNCNKEGDGLDAGSGNMEQSPSDYSDARSGGRMGFSRSYNSSSAYSGRTTGRRWAHNYDKTLTVKTATSVWADRPNARTIRFNKSGAAWVASSSIAREKLTELLDGGGVRTGWTITPTDGSIETYNTTGRLLGIAYRDGYALTMTYSTSTTPVSVAPFVGMLLQVTDNTARALSLDYDGNGFLETMTAPDGLVASYTQTSGGVLTGVTYSDGSTRTYGYTREQLTSISENGTLVKSFTYDTGLRVAGSSAAGGGLAYTMSFGLTSSTTTTPSGATITRQLAAMKNDVVVTSIAVSCPGCTTRTTTKSYDANGFTNLVTQPGGIVTDYDYDAFGHLLQRIDAKSTTVAQAQTRQWDTTLRVPTQVDVAGQRQVFTYNARGQVLTAKVIDTATSAERTSTYTYCGNAGTCGRIGLLLTIDGPRSDVSDVTTLEYRLSNGTGYRAGDLWKVTNAVGQVTEYVSYDGAGRVNQVIDANGVVTDLEYTPRGWLERSLMRGADDNIEADDAITVIDYDAAGVVMKITQPDGSFVSLGYDSARRVTDLTDALGNTVHYTFDAAGNRVQEDIGTSGGPVTRSVAMAYDKLDQLESVLAERTLGGDEILSEFTYDVRGNPDHVIDPLGRTSDSDVDALGRVIQSIANINGSGANRPVTTFGYDGRDNLTRVTDPKGLDTLYSYNGFDELVQLASPDTGTAVYSYNAAGQRVGQTDARTVASTFTYDALGRLTGQQFPATSALDVGFAFDTAPADCLSSELFSTGRLATITDASGSTRYCYDRWGHVVRKAQTVVGGSTPSGGTTLTTETSFNAQGRLIAMTYPSGAVAAFVRNAQGQITRVDVQPSLGASQVTLLSGVTYLPSGPRTGWTFGNGRVMSYDYDRNYEIESVSDDVGDLSVAYALDDASNVVGIGEGTDPTHTYQYDGVDRLLTQSASGSTVEAFTYDATGNRTSKTVGGTTANYTLPSTSHRLTGVGSQTRQYDANGNTTHIGTALELVYGDNNRLNQVKESGAVTRTYVYNGKGERVAKWFVPQASSPDNILFVYDEAGHLLGEYDAAGAPIAEYVWMDGTLVGALNAHDGTTYQYVETDHLGTPRAIVNPATNEIAWRMNLTTTAFGEHLPLDDPDGDSITYTFNLRFPGQYFDGLAGINYNYFRDYDAVSGRFLQSDPIGLQGGMSTFAYSGSRPTGLSDPSGLMPPGAQYSPLPPQSGPISRQGLEGLLGGGRPLSPNELGQLDRGCVGLTSLFQGLGADRPERAPNTACFALKGQAMDRYNKCPRRRFIFSKQGEWTTGYAPVRDVTTGEISPNSIKTAGGHFNYVIYFAEINSYAWMNHGAEEPNQLAYLRPKYPTFDDYPQDMWCTTCSE